MALKEIQDLLEGPIWILWENARIFFQKRNLAKIAWQLETPNVTVGRLTYFLHTKYEAKIRLAGLQEAWDHCATVVLRQGRQFSTKNKASMCSSLHHCIIARARAGEKNAAVSWFFAKVLIYAPRSSVSTKSRSSQRRTWRCKINQLTAEG